jgi:uncharacterized membrane protein
LFPAAIGFMRFATAFFTEIFPPRFVPLVLYAATFSVAGLLELWQWRYAVKNGLIDEEMNPTLISYFSWRMLSLPIAGVAAILIGFVNPMFSGFAFLMMPLAQKVINSRFATATAKMEVI